MFGAMAGLHLLLDAYIGAWTFLIAMVGGGALELIGYVGRGYMYSNPWNKPMFEMQLVCLIIAPTFYAAAIYLTFKHVVLNFGHEHSRLKPALYTWIFIICDIISLVLQAIGGGTAAGATTNRAVNIGNDIMIAGIAFQVLSMLVFGLLAVEWALRILSARRKAGEKPIDIGPGPWTRAAPVSGLVLSYLTILCRCVYRYVLFYSILFSHIITNTVLVFLKCLAVGAVHS